MKYNKLLLILLFFVLNLNAIEPKQVSLQLQWKHQFEFAGFYIAKEKGFYKDLGLDMEIKEFDFGVNVVDEVEKGVSTFGTSYPTLVLEKSNGANVTLLDSTLQSSPHVLISLKSSNIKSIKDFKGKRLMINKDAAQTASFISMLKSKGVSLDDMELVKHTFNINDLIDKKVDITTAFKSNELYILDKLGLEYDIWDPKDYGFDFYDVIGFTSNEFLENNKHAVISFKKATKKGWLYAFSNIEETVDIILKKYNSQNKTRDALIYEANVLKKLAFDEHNQIGNIDTNKIQRIFDIYNIMGLVKNKINLDQFIFNQYKVVLSNKEKEWIKSNVIKVGITPWEPLKIIDYENNSASGIELDRLELIAKKLDLKIQYEYGSWSEMLGKFKDKKIDLLLSTYFTQERTTFGFFSKPYMNIKEYLFVKDDSKITSFEDMGGKSLAIVKGYGTIKKIRKEFPKINIIETKSLNESIGLVLNGKVDALYDLQVRVIYFIKNNVITGLKGIAQESFKASPIHYFSNIEKPILQKILQNGLDSISLKENNLIISKWLNLSKNKQNSLLKSFSSKEKKYLLKNKIVKMCSNPNWEPIEFYNEDTKYPDGIAIDTLKLIEKNLDNKIKFEYVPTKNWSESQKFLKERKCDILPAAIQTLKRQKYASFTSPYLKYKLAIITKYDKPFVDSIDQIIDKSIARKKDSGLIHKLRTIYPNVNIIETEDYLESLKKVSQDEAYCTIATLPVASYYINKFAINNLHIAGYTDMKYNLSIAVRDDRPELLSILNKSLKNISQNDHKEIYNKWSSTQLIEKIDYSLVWKIGLVILILLVIIVYWNYKLKMLVNERTNELLELNKSLNNIVKEEVENNRKNEFKLMEQAKMVSLGEMIGNIAHQWRQPLSIISSATSGMQVQKQMNILTDEEFLNSCKVINNNTQYLSKTIDTFRDFIKEDKSIKDILLQERIDKVLEIITPSLKGNHINLINKIDYSDPIKMILNIGELDQVIINIINNAKDILVERKIEHKIITLDLDKQQDKIIISIEDNGGGIPDDIMPRIFEPYFTTKHQSIGTGLGLHMSYKIVNESLNGDLYVENTKNGAKFFIELPLT